MQKKKDYAISIVRLIGFCLVVTCHICNYYGNELAYWFNSGVQIFLLMSGFLYGQRSELKAAPFYKRNIPKILVDYYIYIILMIPVYLLIVHRTISGGEYLKLAFGIGTNIPGMGHLWYISTIIVCYLVAPGIFKLMRPKVNWIGIILLFGVNEVVFAVLPGFTGAWINCFIIGLLLGSTYRQASDSRVFYKKVLIVSIPCMILMCCTEVVYKYILQKGLLGISGRIANTIFHYGHIAIAVVVMFGVLYLFDKRPLCTGNNKLKVLDLLDKYSYDAYLVHLFFVLGPFSFFSKGSGFWDISFGVLLLIIYIIVAAFILRSLSKVIENKIIEKCLS